MEPLGLYGKLSALPLFVGMGRDELEHIVAHTKFDFAKAEVGETIVGDGDKCGRLLLLTDGDITVETYADDRGYSVCEYLKAPLALQPERAFGLTQRYTCMVTALTPCSLISIGKDEIHRLTDNSLIFRLNLLNIISTSLQKQSHYGWRSVPQSLEQRIRRFFLSHCQHPAGHKTFKIKMARLAAELNDNRLHISHALNTMADQGLLRLSRGKIDIPLIERLSGK